MNNRQHTLNITSLNLSNGSYLQEESVSYDVNIFLERRTFLGLPLVSVSDYQRHGFCQEKPLEIPYSFSLPNSKILKIYYEKLINREFLPSTISFKTIKAPDQTIMQHIFKQYESIVNIKFIEQDINPIVRIFYFKARHRVFESSCHLNNTDKFVKGKQQYRLETQENYLLFNQHFFKSCDQLFLSARKYKTMAHETGHLLGLNHGFDQPNLKPEQNLTSYSLMNYALEYDTSRQLYVLPTSPLPPDIIALQHWLGPNPSQGKGNTIYDLSHYVSQTEQPYLTISTFYDIDGIDLITTKNVNASHVEINLRAFTHSNLHRGFFVMPQEIENLQIGKHSCSITLNQLDNIIDIRAAQKSTLTVDPLHCGEDVIIGFKSSDQLILECLSTPPESWHLSTTTACQPTFLADEVIPCQSQTTLAFDEKNKLHFINFEFKQFNLNSTVRSENSFCNNENIHSDNNHYYFSKLISSLPKEFAVDFLKAISCGAMLGFITNLTTNSLKKYHYNDKQIALIMIAMQTMIIFMFGNPTSGCTSLLLNILGHYMNYHPAFTRYGSILGGEIARDLTYSGLTTLPLRFAGSCLSFFAVDKINILNSWSAKKKGNQVADLEAIHLHCS